MEKFSIPQVSGIHIESIFDLDNIKSANRSDNVHFPRTALISLENSHNICYGSPLSKKYIDSVHNNKRGLYLLKRNQKNI